MHLLIKDNDQELLSYMLREHSDIQSGMEGNQKEAQSSLLSMTIPLNYH